MYKNQTNKMLAQDGVLQKGGTVDPVSGNDVPPGAMPEEVRDDVDAKLSEGEFVVPADVVRYIGLAKLMEMRDEAKRGLQKMTDIGQMGNSKKGAEGEALHGEEGEDEEFASSIDEIMSEEKGGEEEAAYAKGGYVPRSAGYDPAESVALYSRAPIKGFEMIPMSNDTGNTIYIPFINGKPQLQIPPGYVIKAKAAAEAAAPVAPTAGGTGTTAAQGGEGGQDFGGPTGDTGGLPAASDRTDVRSAVLALPDALRYAPYVGPAFAAARAKAEKEAAADKAYLSPFEEPMAAARSAFTVKERALVINSIIDTSIAKKTDPTAELEVTLGSGMMMGDKGSYGLAPTGTIDPGAYEGGFYGPQAFNENARNMGGGFGAPNFTYADDSSDRLAGVTSTPTTVGGPIAPPSISGESLAPSFDGSTNTGVFDARTSGESATADTGNPFGGDAYGGSYQFAKGGMVTKKDKGFVSSRQHSKNKRTGFVSKK